MKEFSKYRLTLPKQIENRILTQLYALEELSKFKLDENSNFVLVLDNKENLTKIANKFPALKNRVPEFENNAEGYNEKLFITDDAGSGISVFQLK